MFVVNNKDMNKELMFSSKTDLWATPKEYFEKVNNEFFLNLDVCANKENAKCERFFTEEDNGLSQEWNGRVWMNPPYGRTIGKWVEKAFINRNNCDVIVCLLPARTDTKWFHDYIYGVAEVRFIKGRLKFGDAKNSAPFPSMLIIYRK